MYDLIRFNKAQKYVVWDTETEGLNSVLTRPYQFSWIICTQDKIISEHDRFIWFEDLNMSDKAAQVTGFDFDRYKKEALSPKQVYDEFAQYLYDPSYVSVAHNLLNYDTYILKNLQLILGEKVDYSYLLRSIDTKPLAVAIEKAYGFVRQENYDKYDFLTWQYSLSSIVEKGLKSNLGHLLKVYDIEHDKDKLHDGMYDVQSLCKILFKQIYQIEVPNLIEQAN
jgi:DNA polymerase III alpha subunit (gram-positive type)